MQGGEYFKLAQLISHYTEHQSGKMAYVDFIDFLNDHYLNVNHHEKEHKHLPFKNHSSTHIAVADHRLSSIATIYEIRIETISSQLIFPEKSIFSDTKIVSVWNPPKHS
jgi:pyruvate dehydrogenase complex dehydrogenase (E1) component